MPRKKLQLAFIANEKARKASYMKRKKDLLNKVRDLSTLCGVKACALIYSQDDLEPDVWPSTLEVENVIEQFKNMPGEKISNLFDQEKFLRKMIDKINKKIDKQRTRTLENAANLWIYENLFNKNRDLDNLQLPEIEILQRKIAQMMVKLNEQTNALGQTLSPQLQVQEQELDHSARRLFDLNYPPVDNMEFGPSKEDEIIAVAERLKTMESSASED